MSKFSRQVVFGLALSALALTALADQMSDAECGRIKAWVSGVNAVEKQLEVLLSHKYFTHHFGAKYEDLTLKQIRYLGKTAESDCRQWGDMSATQLQTATAVFHESFQEKWLVSPRAQPDETLLKAALKDSAATAEGATLSKPMSRNTPGNEGTLAPATAAAPSLDANGATQAPSASAAAETNKAATSATQSKVDSILGKFLDKLGQAADKATDKALSKLDSK